MLSTRPALEPEPAHMSLVKAESISLLAARAAVFGVQPAAGWQTLQPEPAGIVDFYPKLTTVQPKPPSLLCQLEQPEVVDLDAAPKLTHDLTKDWLDMWAEAAFLASAKHPGGTGQAHFTPTARAANGYSVAANGNLPQNTLAATEY